MIRLTHRIGRTAFLGLERVLNGVFGPTLNPFYYLGAITYLMFWIIVLSGFYIYAFYDTGVNDAFESVEYYTVQQWYLGGIMRSLHRYASDGMIVFGVLHMLRNFVFDRYREFRWFSWYTGILVLWLIYIAGINGYWLPWDKLAQFAATATAEWLDALPIFSAPLARNFLEQGSVNDRFFTLLSFIHLGIPLGTFAIIWVHTQRVPRAKTSAPRVLTVGIVLSMLALALVWPALSQGPADLDSVPSVLYLDWFYLWAYPLLYTWGPGKVWLIVGAVTGVLLSLPFLTLKKRVKGLFEITTVPGGHSVTSREGETVLEAALRQGLALPYQCRDGACGACKGTVLSGKVDYGTYQKGVLTDTEIKEGKALFCCAKPLSDLNIECEEVGELQSFPVKTMKFRVEKMTRAAPEVMLLDLAPEGDEHMSFMAGQYVAVQLEDGTKRSYSIANAPHDSRHLQLHIRHVKGGRFTGHVFGSMKEGDVLQVEGPLGSFFLHEDSNKPIIFMSGGCGFGSIKGMVEHAFEVGLDRPMTLYWGARTPVDLYSDLPAEWQKQHGNFKFIPVLSEAKAEHNWQGRTGLVHEAILEDFPDLTGYQIYACGSPEMVEAGHAPFVARGLPENQYFADKFFDACDIAKAQAAAQDIIPEGAKHG